MKSKDLGPAPPIPYAGPLSVLTRIRKGGRILCKLRKMRTLRHAPSPNPPSAGLLGAEPVTGTCQLVVTLYLPPDKNV